MPISNEIRERIVRLAERHRFSDEYAALMIERAHIAVAIIRAAMTPEERDAALALKRWLPHAGNATVAYVHEAQPDHYGYRLDAPHCVADTPEEARVILRAQPLPDHLRFHKTAIGDELYALASAHMAKVSAFTDALLEARQDMAMFITAYSSLKKLAAAWPEGEPFYRHLLEQKTPNLPAVPVSRINTRFDLPVDEDDAPAKVGVLSADLSAGVEVRS